MVGGSVHLKLENLQHTGSFKLRGAANKLACLPATTRSAGVVAASTGNHGAAVAFGARQDGIQAIVFAPENASPEKLRNVESLGAEVRRVGEDCLVAERAARTFAAEHSMEYISPYNDPDVVAGQGTVGSELVAQLEEFLSRHRTLGRATTRSGAAMPTSVRWHMVGHLQRNKVKQIIPLVQLIHSVDSLRLAEELHNHAARLDRVVDVLLQVNASLEPAKFGVAAPAALHLAEQIDTMIHLRLRGVMAMAPEAEKAEASRPYFARAAEIFTDIRDAKIGGRSFNALSMGMSHDFEAAVEEGANVVRIGQALFGNSGEAQEAVTHQS